MLVSKIKDIRKVPLRDVVESNKKVVESNKKPEAGGFNSSI